MNTSRRRSSRFSLNPTTLQFLAARRRHASDCRRAGYERIRAGLYIDPQSRIYYAPWTPRQSR